MKTVFIKIENITEINTSKISVRDLHNRYIDKEGRMYGLKYNRQTRKVSIIRIIRTPAKSAEYFRQLLRSQKKEEIISQRTSIETTPVEEKIQISTEEDKEKSFDYQQFINNTIELMQAHKGRISGIMMNIKNSRMIQDNDKTNTTMLNDIFRNMEIDGVVRIDKTLSNYKEIKNYPRSITYYISKLDSKNRKIIDELDSDSRKMTFVYAAEMFYSIKSLYRTIYKIFTDLDNFISGISTGSSKDISSVEKQYFIDAKTSVENTIEESIRILDDIKNFDEFLKDARNF